MSPASVARSRKDEGDVSTPTAADAPVLEVRTAPDAGGSWSEVGACCLLLLLLSSASPNLVRLPADDMWPPCLCQKVQEMLELLACLYE